MSKYALSKEHLQEKEYMSPERAPAQTFHLSKSALDSGTG